VGIKFIRKKIAFLLFWVNFTSCYKDHLYVRQEWVDKSSLASTHVDTPDVKQRSFIDSQQLVVSWNFPQSLFEKELLLSVKIRFWDDTQQEIRRPILKRSGFFNFIFPQNSSEKDQRILTYSVQVLKENGTTVACWNHQLWTNLISLPKE